MLVLGLILIVSVTVAAVVTIVSQRDSGDTDKAVATTAAAGEPVPEDAAPSVELPDGDYTTICAELARQAQGFTRQPTVESYVALLETVDFDALIAASTDWLRPSVETLEREHEEVLTVLKEIDDASKFQVDSLPPDFVEALKTIGAVATKKCQLG